MHSWFRVRSVIRMNKLDVSIVIVNWNTRAIVSNCLRSVFEETDKIKFEVIIVDNASTDGSVEMIREEFPEVIIICNKSNRGFAAANNQGIQIGRGEYVLLLNSDTIILDNAISKSIFFARNNPKAAVTSCRVLNSDKTLQPTCFMFPSICNMILSSTYIYKIFPKNRFFGRERMSWWKRNDVRDVDAVTGCFMLVRKDAIGEIGNMDERFFMYAEETDWCYRFKQAGWQVMFMPDAEIIHLHKGSSKKIESTMRLQLSGSILLFFEKHKSRTQYILACLFTALFFFARVPYWFVIAIISKKKRSACLDIVRTYSKGFILSLGGGRMLCVKRKSNNF